MTKGANHKVVCPGCAESYHLTTAKYRPNIDANAGMLRLKDEYKSYGWDEPPPDPTAGYGFLECPGCGAMLAPSGRLLVKEKEKIDKVYKCEICGEEFDMPIKKALHMKKHKKEKENAETSNE